MRCASVGWLIHDGEDVKALAPNMAGLENEANVQVSGVMRIPARCILRLVKIEEPPLTASSCAAPSSHLVRGSKPLGSEPESASA